jgi:D-arginine dehydrogenase
LLLSCCDELAAEPGDYRESPAVLEQIAAKLASTQPGLQSLSISSTWVGQRVFASDRRFVIGYDPRDDRVFNVAGLGGHGVTASYAVGRLAADLIVDGVAEGSGAFAPQRLFQHHAETRYDRRP